VQSSGVGDSFERSPPQDYNVAVLLGKGVGMLSRAIGLLLLGMGCTSLGICHRLALLSEPVKEQNEAVCPQCRDATEPTAEILASAPVAMSWTLQKQANEVTVFFSARDGKKFVQDLSLGDIHIADDGKPALRITEFRHQQDLPLRVGLLIDTSGSVNPRFRFEKDASIQFLRAIVRRGLDRAFVMGFSEETTLWQDYTDDPGLLASSVAALRNGGGTAFFDAVRIACDKLADGEPRDQTTARVLVILSDGNNNVGHTTLKNAFDTAQFRDVTIYTINTRIESLDPRLAVATAEGDRALKNLAIQSGGRFFSRMTAQGVGHAFMDIEQEMRNRYVLFYQPEGLVPNGRFRSISIVARQSGKHLKVQARRGYYATRVANN